MKSTAAKLGRRGAAVRTAVLEATLDELVEHGIDGVTVAAVAARAGVHETSVYRRWRTREDLIVDALLDRSAAQIPVPDTGSLRGDLIEVGRLVSRYLSAPLGRAVVRMTALTVEDEALARARADFLASRVATMGVVVERAIERGELPAGTDARLVLELLVAPLHMRTILTAEPLPEDLPERTVDVLLDGLRPPDSR
ncbi:TetR family transcriptional regulator [Mycobacterium xenopi RIVM700367]|uniref:TetR-like C-terminal domain-containing protein n=1 Tax=Mycobacterium xenopi TaxID=1789 RepID=UPI00025AE80B|nr:TetR-like C-terminal domain-containing protein [Mycobacterium xenopi]EID11495.1 TetR family transcriptional regulator [Mycobacterium xenopi RIVM700367]